MFVLLAHSNANDNELSAARYKICELQSNERGECESASPEAPLNHLAHDILNILSTSGHCQYKQSFQFVTALLECRSAGRSTGLIKTRSFSLS